MGGALPLTLAGLAGFGWLLIAVTGLHIALRIGGIPLLGQSAAVAAGAFLTAAWTPTLPLLLAISLAVVVTGLAGWLLGLLASLRVAGDPAVATWALGWLALTTVTAGVFGTSEADLPIPAHLVVPAGGFILTLSTTAEVVTALLFASVGIFGVRRLATGPLDTRFALVRRSPEFAVTIGIPIARLRAGALGCGCALGALSGAGYLTLQGVSGPSDVSPTLSIELLAAVLVGPRRWWGIVVGAVALELLLHLSDPAIASALLIFAATVTRRRAPRFQGPPELSTPGVTHVAPMMRPAEIAGLSVADVSVSLSGREILTGFSLELAPGEIHALIGPNGAGKTTALRVVSGEVRRAGAVVVAGQPPGTGSVARTLQSTPSTEGISPLALVTAAVPAPRFVGLRHLIAARSARAELLRRTSVGLDALELVGFEGTSGVDDRLLLLACAYGTGARVIAMDEPAAGVERNRIADAITAIAARGRTVLLVEHDLRLVRQVADRASLLLDGRVAITATVPEIFDDPLVRDSYLGVTAAGATTPG